ncbi:MAG: hypothetical protein ACHQE6_09575 [Solirubrobacterales bacterium]
MTLAAILSAAPVACARWSAPARPPGCAAALSSAAPLIVFPSSSPQSRSGPGALLWDGPRGCAPDPVAAEAFGATLSTDDLPGRGFPLGNGVGGLAGVAAATGTAAGQVVVVGTAAGQAVVAGSSAREGALGEGALAEGRTVGTFAARSLGGPATPVAASSAYLGDTVLASPVRTQRAGWALAVRVQRHYSSAFAPLRLVPAGPGPAPVSAVAATMDYRADILLAWAAGGAVYAREIAAGGTVGPPRRLGSAGSGAEIGALISDDGHAIVAWSSRSVAPGGGTRTTVELSLCEASPRAVLSARRPMSVERFRDPAGSALPAGNGRPAGNVPPAGDAPPVGPLRLIRLSSEAVMMAWTGTIRGRYVVRVSPVSLRRGAWAPVTISAAYGQDALLADLVPGPHAEALVLWTTAPRLPGVAPDVRRRAILAAHGHYAGAGEVAFAAPEAVAPPGSNGTPAAAFDPGTGQALAAWVTRTGGAAGGSRIAYALRPAEPVAVPASSSTTLANVFCCCLRLGWP